MKILMFRRAGTERRELNGNCYNRPCLVLSSPLVCMFSVELLALGKVGPGVMVNESRSPLLGDTQ
jgi:hypothetical protein